MCFRLIVGELEIFLFQNTEKQHFWSGLSGMLIVKNGQIRPYKM